MRQIGKLTAAILAMIVTGLASAITPDQELYNNLVIYHEVLSDDPSGVGEVLVELRKFDATALSADGAALLNAMKERYGTVAKLQRRIGHHETDGEQAIADRAITDGLQGGLAAAGTLAQLDYASNQRIDGGMLLYAITGMIGGAVKHHSEGKKIKAAVERAVVEEHEEQKRILSIFDQDLNRFRKSPAFSKFDRALVYQPGLTESFPKNTPESYFGAIKERRIMEMRVVFVNAVIADVALSTEAVADWNVYASILVKEWPTCLSKNHPVYSMALANLSHAALDSGDYLQAQRLSGDAISSDPTNAIAFNNRAVARLQLGRVKEAIADIESAITIDPENYWYHCSKARIYARGTGGADNAVKALGAAYKLGFCDIVGLRGDPDFQRILSNKAFLDHTTVKTETTTKNGLVFSNVYLKNNSPFYLTTVQLISKVEGWNPELKAELIAPGETHNWSWVSKPPANKPVNFSLMCDQMSK